MKTTGGSIQLAKGTRFLLSKARQLFQKVLGLDKKQITFHPTLPLEHRKFYQVTLIDDYKTTDLGFQIINNYQRGVDIQFAVCLFVIAFGVSDFLTRISYDEAFAYKWFIAYPEEMYVIDKGLQGFRNFRNKYLNYLGEEIVSDYDYNIKK